MKYIFKPEYLLLPMLLLGSTWLGAQTGKTIKTVPVQPSSSLNGEDLFHQYCTVCHGNRGKGDGPAAEALKKAPADLTQITRKHDGKFPELAVQRFISGEDVVAAHGTRDMPTWGTVFNGLSSSGVTQARAFALLKYVEQLQAR